MKTLNPKSGNVCFGCGADNPIGLKLTFHGDTTAAKAWAEFQPLDFMAGGAGMMHGGFIAMLLDEASSKVLSILEKRGVTRNLEVSYEKPVSLSHPIRLDAKLVKSEGRKHFIEATIQNRKGEILATSKALFLVFGTTAER